MKRRIRQDSASNKAKIIYLKNRMEDRREQINQTFIKLLDATKHVNKSLAPVVARLVDIKRRLIEQKYGIFSIFIPEWWRCRRIYKMANKHEKGK
jgi:hypothetical protein